MVDRLDLVKLGFVRAERADTGRPGYDPLDLLELYLYGKFVTFVCPDFSKAMFR